MRFHCSYKVYYLEGNPYFNAVMLKKQPNLLVTSREITLFTNSRMGRFLLRVDIIFHGQPVALMTSHLESTRPCETERINQLGVCLEKVTFLSLFCTLLVILPHVSFSITHTLESKTFGRSNFRNSGGAMGGYGKQNPPEGTLDLTFFFRYKYITCLKNHLSPARGDSLPYWFQGNLRPCLF